MKKKNYFCHIEQKHIETSWLNALKYIKQNLIFNRQKQLLDIILGDFKDIKFTTTIKKLLPQLGATQLTGYEINNCNSDFLSDWLVSTNNISSYCYILVGVNLRYELPIYNLKLRKQVLKEKTHIIICGPNFNTYTYPTFNIGNSLEQLSLLIKGKIRIAQSLIEKEDVILLFGNSFFSEK